MGCEILVSEYPSHILIFLHLCVLGVGMGIDGFKVGESMKMSDSFQRSLECSFVSIFF